MRQRADVEREHLAGNAANAPGGLTDPATKVTPTGSVSVNATSNASEVLVASCATVTEYVTRSPECL